MLLSVVVGALMGVAGIATGLGCWYAWRALHATQDILGRGPEGETRRD